MTRFDKTSARHEMAIGVVAIILCLLCVAVLVTLVLTACDATADAEDVHQATYAVTLYDGSGEVIEEWRGIEDVWWYEGEPKVFMCDGKHVWIRGGIVLVKEE